MQPWAEELSSRLIRWWIEGVGGRGKDVSFAVLFDASSFLEENCLLIQLESSLETEDGLSTELVENAAANFAGHAVPASRLHPTGHPQDAFVTQGSLSFLLPCSTLRRRRRLSFR